MLIYRLECEGYGLFNSDSPVWVRSLMGETMFEPYNEHENISRKHSPGAVFRDRFMFACTQQQMQEWFKRAQTKLDTTEQGDYCYWTGISGCVQEQLRLAGIKLVMLDVMPDAVFVGHQQVIYLKDQVRCRIDLTEEWDYGRLFPCGNNDRPDSLLLHGPEQPKEMARVCELRGHSVYYAAVHDVPRHLQWSNGGKLRWGLDVADAVGGTTHNWGRTPELEKMAAPLGVLSS
jgi:hypothetical protein